MSTTCTFGDLRDVYFEDEVSTALQQQPVLRPEPYGGSDVANPTCLDCPADISHLNYRSKRCAVCALIRRTARRADRDAANPERVAASMAAWRAANPDKMKANAARRRAADPAKFAASRARYRAANPDKVKASLAKYRAANPDRMAAGQAKWRAANPDKVKANNARRRADPETLKARARYRAANPDKVKASLAKYRAANPDKVAAKSAVRRARRKNAPLVEKFTTADVVARDGIKCKCCDVNTTSKPGPMKRNLDHVIPLSKGGDHTMANAQVLCQTCNSRKGDRFLPDGMGEQLRLLG